MSYDTWREKVLVCLGMHALPPGVNWQHYYGTGWTPGEAACLYLGR
jgi:hypothetical protein